MISKIADNCHHASDFFEKVEKVIEYLIQDKSSTIIDFITDYFSYNKRILLFLLKKGYINPDESFMADYLINKPKRNFFTKIEIDRFQIYYYLYPGMK